MPVSDDGGSTSEIVKVVGGPGIGDIRSRLVRLSETKTAVYKLLSYRLPTGSPASDSGTCPAKMEWLNILEGNHHLWQNISLPYRETIRSFLLQFHYKILKEIGGGGLIITSGGESNRTFDFRGGSLGNFFLTGCRIFFNSLEASIFQFARVTRCPSATMVLPVIATNHNPVAIGCTLRNGGVIFGQCEISHPGTVTNPPPLKPKSLHRQLLRPFAANNLSKSLDLSSSFLQDNSHNNSNNNHHGMASSSSSTASTNLFFSKNMHETPPLASPIRRVFYINGERAETFPRINALVPEHLETKKTIIYAMGSLYTSLLPCLVVAGVGSLISQDYSKILLLNGTHDRETESYTALDFILAITDTLNYSVIAEHGGGEMVRKVMNHPYITHVLYTEDSLVFVEVDRIEALGITCIKVPKAGTIVGCERLSYTERGGGSIGGSGGNEGTFTQGHFGVEELRSALEPLLL
ncbi:hypothetical protein BDR26DRAFT_838075 [Obelidium mucronatum]|nr:hypothetical protein BDR26DRAFT_838075 [Obelidium mucronatum]